MAGVEGVATGTGWCVAAGGAGAGCIPHRSEAGVIVLTPKG